MKKFNCSRILVISISVLLLIIGSVFAVMADESTTVVNKNNVVIGHSEDYTVKAVGTIRATVDEEGFYSAPIAKTTTNDKQDDDVFAGWYKDSACNSPLKADELSALINNEEKKDEIIYAKFVSREILNVKAQLQNTVDSTSSNAILRVVTTVDSANYQKVGFNIEFNGNTYSKDSDTVSKKLSVIGNTGKESKISPTEFHDGSLYFMAVNLTKIQAASFEKEAKAVPYWVTLDGTKVENSNVKTKSVFQGMPTVCETRVTDANGDKEEYYLTLEKAFYVLDGTNYYLTEGDTVTVIQNDVEIASRLNVYKNNITLTNEANRDVVITRSYNDSHFMYYNEATLTVEGTVPEGDGKGSLTFDGEKVSSTRGFIESGTDGGSNLTLENVSIKNILATRSGAAVKAHGTATITGCTFENNIININEDTVTNGGAIYFSGSGKTLSVDACEFISNQATSGNGGAIYVYLGKEVAISNTEFDSNSAPNGGALYVWRAVATVSDSTFRANASTEANGGAIYHGEDTKYDTKTLTLTSCTFDSNHTAPTGNGGAVYMNYGPAKVSGSTFISNGTTGADMGGAIYVNDGTTTISGSEFSSNQATSKGGAVYDNLGTVTVKENCTFSENSAANGGALYVYQGTTTGISDSTFTSNNSTEANGGAIYFGEDTENVKELTLTNCTFDSNNTVVDGGALYVNSGTTTISGSGFSSNQATNKGGAVYDNEGTVTIQGNCTFSENSAAEGGALCEQGGATEISDSSFVSNISNVKADAENGGGGAIYHRAASSSTKLKLTRCSFTSNKATGNTNARGGAVYIYRGGAEIIESTFSSNGLEETSYGGAIYAREGDTDISNTDFEGNTATTNGGAVYIHTKKAIVDITEGCTFLENVATKHGGAIYNSMGALTVDNCALTSNTAQTSGGAIYVDTADATLSVGTSTFNSNQATSKGGAVYDNEGAVTIEETCTFLENSAANGGALYVYQGATEISNSTFTSNASTEANGGAIYYGEDTENSTTLTLTGCTFNSNNAATAGYGGAVYVNSGTAGISGNTFTSNGADGAKFGGAISINSGTTTISDSDFSLNQASSQGGAVHDNTGTVTIESDCTFLENSAETGGAMYVSEGTTTVSSAEFSSNNTTSSGGAIYYRDNDGSAKLTIADCEFTSNYTEKGSDVRGGAIYIVSGEADVSGSTFTSNGSGTTTNGGAIYVRGGKTVISDTDFTSNRVAANGGAVYINMDSAEVEIKDGCIFTENNATTSGGAIYNYKAKLTVDNCTLTSNISTEEAGGAIYVDTATATLNVSASTFSSNQATGNGGAVYNNLGTVTVKTTCSFEGNSAANGGAVYVYQGTTGISNSTFTANTSNGAYGGAIFYGESASDGKELTVTSCSFTSNDTASAGYGGAMYVNSGIAGISGSTFTTNGTTGVDMGGAIYVNDGTTTISGSEFVSNKATSNGGAVYENLGTVNIQETCSFSENSATNGGALYVNSGMTIISGSDFSMNTATTRGGAVYDDEGTVTIKETCAFSENSAAEGGALCEYSGETEVSDSSFTSNVSNSGTSNAGGGAIYYRGKTASTKLKLNRCTFTSNEATGNTGARAGAVYIYRGGAQITGSTFTSNGWHTTDEETPTEVITTVNGGALYVRDGKTEITGTDFEGNKATTSGGAVYINLGTYTVEIKEDCTFSANSATQYGGAIYNLKGKLTVDDCTLTLNTVETYSGGAIYVSDSTATLDVSASTFTSNSAYLALDTADEEIITVGGGAIYTDAAPVTIENSFFDQNSGRRGGTIYANQATATLTVSASTFTSNRAYEATDITTMGGGAIYFNAATGEISNSFFDQNSGRRGGAIHVNAGSVAIENGCTFSGNTAARGGAIFYYPTEGGSITDAIFVGNTATVGGAIQCYSKMQIDGCVFEQNSASKSDNAMLSSKYSFALTNTTLINQTEADFQDSNTRITLLTQENTLSTTTSIVENIHDADDGHQLSLLTNIDEAEFEAYCGRIESMGFELRSENEMNESDENKNIARTYYSTERGYMLHTYWVEYSQEVRTQVAVIDEAMLEPLVALETAESTETTEAVCAPLFHQLAAISYTAKVSAWEGGMGYIIRLTDGRFVIIDGGSSDDNDDDNDPDNMWNDAYEIAKFLVENNTRSDHKIVIAAWILTHAHSDHVGAFENFVKHTGGYSKYHFTNLKTKGVIPAEDDILDYEVELQSIMFNACDTDEQMLNSSSETSDLFTNYIESTATNTVNGHAYSYSDYFANTKIYKPLTGQEYRFADTSIEILHTMSDFLPQTIAQEPDNGGGDYNVQSVVSMVDVDCNNDNSDRFFIMGDTTKVACDEMSKRYGTYMESDYVQVAHHGYNEFTNYVGTDLEYKNSRRHGATQEIYELILKDDNSTIVMWPTSDVRFAAKTLADTTATNYIYINDWLYRTGQPDANKHWIAESVSDENRTIEFE